MEWNEAEVRALVGEEKFERTLETVRKISAAELMRFKIGWNGLQFTARCAAITARSRSCNHGNSRVLSPAIFSGSNSKLRATGGCANRVCLFWMRERLPDAGFAAEADRIAFPFVHVPETDFLLDGVTRVAVKLVMNALSTCTMVRLGRVMGNSMVWVVPSNLKLIDRATRYITRLTVLAYEAANRLAV